MDTSYLPGAWMRGVYVAEDVGSETVVVAEE
jgi:hypothetical protein